MKRYLAAAILLAVPMAQAYGEIPGWVKESAGWWAEGAIPEEDFVRGIEFLIGQGVITVDAPDVAPGQQGGVPDWVKTSAGWWAEGAISDAEFARGIGHLIGAGVIAVNADAQPEAEPASALEAELEACEDLKKAYQRSDCREEVGQKIERQWYLANADPYQVGPVTFYYPGLGTEGNELFTEGDQAILTVRMLAVNSGSDSNVAMMCTGPSICSYDVWDGSAAFKFSGMDFTSGQLVLKPGDARVFNMLFGPNIGYGGTTFEYDPAREYVFRISESWGSAEIPLDAQ